MRCMQMDLTAIAARFPNGQLDDLLEEDIRGERQPTIEELWPLLVRLAPEGSFVGEDYDVEGDALDRELLVVRDDGLCRIRVSCVADYYTLAWVQGEAPASDDWDRFERDIQAACSDLGLTYLSAGDHVLHERVPGLQVAGQAQPATVYQALFAREDN